MLSNVRQTIRHIMEASERCEIHLNSASIRNINASMAITNCHVTSQVTTCWILRNSLSFFVILCHSLSFFVILCHSLPFLNDLLTELIPLAEFTDAAGRHDVAYGRVLVQINGIDPFESGIAEGIRHPGAEACRPSPCPRLFHRQVI